jgi:serine/threonine protein kinase
MGMKDIKLKYGPEIDQLPREMIDSLREIYEFSQALRKNVVVPKSLSGKEVDQGFSVDLKPENLLLCSETDDSTVKIADFGFAKRIKDLSPKETACGTPGYVAPEILRGDKYGAEVDIWSMGVMLYVLLSGTFPFLAKDKNLTKKNIIFEKLNFSFPAWQKVSHNAKDIVSWMLEKRQDMRPSILEIK